MKFGPEPALKEVKPPRLILSINQTKGLFLEFHSLFSKQLENCL